MTKRNNNNFKTPNGSSLVMVLWIFVLLTAITVVVAQTSRLDTRITATAADKLRCKWACRAAAETVIGILNDDERHYDSFGDLWSDNPDELEDVELDGCSFSVEVIDEFSKLNVNIANKKMLMSLPEMTEPIANAILDWRDKNDEERIESVESGYYMNLPHPYPAKNKGFTTIRELLRVKDITDELFYGPKNEDSEEIDVDQNTEHNAGWINYLTCYSRQRNRDYEGSRRLNINSASQAQLARSLQITQPQAKWIVEKRSSGLKSLGDFIALTSGSAGGNVVDTKTALGFIDNICVNDKKVLHGRININTASKVVLMAMFEGKENIADEIIAYRQGQASGIETYDQLTQISSLTKDVLKKTLDLISLRSSVFTIRSTATARLTGYTLKTEAVVDRDRSPVQIIYFCQGAKY